MNNKIESWRLIVGGISILFIIAMWVIKDVGSIYANLTKEELIPVVVTSICVTLLKVAFIAIGVIVLRKIFDKSKQ